MGYRFVKDTRKFYRIYRRKTKKTKGGRPVFKYYFALWDFEAQRYSSAKSTGQTNRAAAETWLAAYLAEGKPSALTLEGFAVGIFDENSQYLTHRAQRGREMSWNHRRHCATYLKTYILPYFDKIRLVELTTLDIEGFQSWLLKQPIRGDGKQTLSPWHFLDFQKAVFLIRSARHSSREVQLSRDLLRASRRFSPRAQSSRRQSLRRAGNTAGTE
jgi:hypothetical protein